MGADPIWGLGWKVLERAGGCEWNVSRPVQADVVRGGFVCGTCPGRPRLTWSLGKVLERGSQVQLARSPVVL